MSWNSRRLGDLVGILSGFPFEAARFGDTGELPIIRIRDVLPGQSSTFYSGAYDQKYLIRSGSILIGMDGEFNLARWKSDPALLNQRVCKIWSASPELDEGYLCHFLPIALKQIEAATTFVTVKHLSVKAIRDIQIPLPTLDEQKRIAAVLDKADALRRQRQESLQLTEELLQSVFIDMFVSNGQAAEWEPQSVESLALDKRGSIRTGPFGSQLLHTEFVDEGIVVLGIDNAVKNRFEWGKPRFITPEKYEGLKRYRVFPGDIIITIMGTLGRCAIVPDDIPEAINTKHLCCLTLDPKKCLPEFLHAAFLYHPGLQQQMGVRTKGAIMPALNMGIIKELMLPLPPVSLQKSYRDIAARLRDSSSHMEEAAASSENLFSSLQQRAFRGELDLSRLQPEPESDSPAAAASAGHVFREGIYNRPGYFIAPSEIETQMMAIEEKLNLGIEVRIPWSEDYFKYRTLSQLLSTPFSFQEIMAMAEHDMEEIEYDMVKEKVFDYAAAGLLEQQFDEKRREIVFHPRA